MGKLDDEIRLAEQALQKKSGIKMNSVSSIMDLESDMDSIIDNYERQEGRKKKYQPPIYVDDLRPSKAPVMRELKIEGSPYKGYTKNGFKKRNRPVFKNKGIIAFSR